jgi:ribonuclease HI
MEQLDDDALSIYTDGSKYEHPRRGGIGFRFVWTDDAGKEATHDSDLPGYREATNNQMEIKAAIEALRETVARRSPVELSRFKKVVIYSDSDYLVSGHRSALFSWPREAWMTASGKPVENAELWKELLQVAHNTGKRVDFKWIPGKKGTHAKAVDKLAKQSAQGHLNEPLVRSRTRRSKSHNQVEIGSVGMEAQTMSIYVRSEKRMAVQRCYRYRYEVVSDDSPYSGLVDDMDSYPPIFLSAGHTYSVRVNDDPGNPRIIELLGELVDPPPDD